MHLITIIITVTVPIPRLVSINRIQEGPCLVRRIIIVQVLLVYLAAKVQIPLEHSETPEVVSEQA
ncbi:hypothetical protein AWRI1631_111580 [Saccharomyces cerevisiae AWRI1631]|uniref:Uncharacterized protein n=1 Tax=Saccharomyces cerevisiae (strain AWRI1631) TaxID=545124 RepID=B5VM89_YEAS6|nr:hypothetical protein AWRI1631_111580 [Saccharomyces cerevisiae AWRI1631]